MDLIMWRHAEAEDGYPDMARQLTETGREQAKKMAVWLRIQLHEDLQSVRILVSPAKRAQQTASALSEDFETVHEVGLSASANQILAAANWPYVHGTVVVVGHQPTLGEAARLILPQVPDGLFFKKGAVWWFSYQRREDVVDIKLHAVKYPEML